MVRLTRETRKAPRTLAQGAPAVWQRGPGAPAEVVILGPPGTTYRLSIDLDDLRELCRLLGARPCSGTNDNHPRG